MRDFTQLSTTTEQYFKDGRYDVAVINLGTNDAAQKMSVKEFKQRMKVYVNRIKKVSPGTKIVLLEPIKPKNYDKNEPLQAYTQARKDMALDYGWGYIDTHLLGDYNDEYYEDGTHPNTKGKKAIAKMVFDYLSNN